LCNLFSNALSVSRYVASDNLMIAEDGMERVWTEAFVPRFKIPFGRLHDGGEAREIRRTLYKVASRPKFKQGISRIQFTAVTAYMRVMVGLRILEVV